MGTFGHFRVSGGMACLQVGPREVSPTGQVHWNKTFMTTSSRPANKEDGPVNTVHFSTGLSRINMPIVGQFNTGASPSPAHSPSVRGKKGIARGRAPLSSNGSAINPTNILNHNTTPPLPKSNSHGASHSSEFIFSTKNDLVL